MLGDLGKLIVAKGFKKLPKVKKIARSGQTARDIAWMKVLAICTNQCDQMLKYNVASISSKSSQSNLKLKSEIVQNSQEILGAFKENL